MITVKYERYYNDYNNKQESRSFYNLEEVADWLFSMAKSYKMDLYFVDPDMDHSRNGKLHLDTSCIKSVDGKWNIYVEQIEDYGKIIYSCGTFTNGICHWNDEIKQWLKKCRERRVNPQFNFG